MTIKPTIGRIVWYIPDGNEGESFEYYSDQPCMAQVTYVHADDVINILVTDHEGNQHPMAGVGLIDCYSDSSPGHCEWMPYQKNQAEKTKSS